MLNFVPPAGATFEADERDDASIVRAAQQHGAAFGPIYDRYLARVYRFVRSRSGSNEEAADLTQEVFLRALDALPAYQDRGVPFAAWLFRIARNAVTDAHRRRRPASSIETLPQDVPPLIGDTPEDAAVRRESLERLARLVMRLDAGKRELLALRFAAGLTAPEIAVVTGRSEAAVKKQMSRTLNTLKEHYRAD
jgi:RNA polymerase sigma-70 factor (ECF subfamily)